MAPAGYVTLESAIAGAPQPGSRIGLAHGADHPDV
jgi:hypothetical protein